MSTITDLEDISIGGGEHLYLFSVALDSVYATGGEPIDLAANRTIKELWCHSPGYGFDWDVANQKLKVLKSNVSGTVTLDPSSLLTDAVANNDVTVTGLATTDNVIVIPPITLEAGLVVQTAVVSSADTLRVRIQNTSAGTVNGASATWTWLIPGAREVLAGTDLSALTDVRGWAIGS